QQSTVSRGGGWCVPALLTINSQQSTVNSQQSKVNNHVARVTGIDITHAPRQSQNYHFPQRNTQHEKIDIS
ncbi:hypothetical protein QT970_26270, partial [Microcoleus sp. herbarium8]|uniref:hypothetical protein n=1 Tax=Microcoleus sp. herbarium8 TaxID=3055436 RepID=UPI002FD018BA